MTKMLSKTVGSPRFILYATTKLSIATWVIGTLTGMTRAEWPGWLQGIGSVWAILVAVWVSWNQNEAQRVRDELAETAEINGVVRSLRAEVETTLHYATSRIAEHLNRSQPGTPFEVLFPIPENPFPIFDALIPKLGVITDDEIQRGIIHTYVVAKSLAATIRHHNLILNELNAADVRQGEQPYAVTDVAVRKYRTDLTTYSDALRAEFNPAMAQMHALLLKLYDKFPASCVLAAGTAILGNSQDRLNIQPSACPSASGGQPYLISNRRELNT